MWLALLEKQLESVRSTPPQLPLRHAIAATLLVLTELLVLIMHIFLIGALLALVLFLGYYVFMYRPRALASIPGPTPFPLIGTMYMVNLRFFSRSFHEALLKFGKLVRINMPAPHICTSDPDIMKQILASDYEVWQRDPRVQAHYNDIAGGLILLNNGSEWKLSRELFTPAFSFENLMRLRPLVQSKARQFVDALEPFARSGQPFDLQQWARHYTFDVIGLMVLGTNFATLGQESSPYERAWAFILEYCNHKLMFADFPYWEYVPTPALREYKRQLALLNGMTQKAIERCAQPDVDPTEATMVAHMQRDPRARAWPMDVCFSVQHKRKPITHPLRIYHSLFRIYRSRFAFTLTFNTPNRIYHSYSMVFAAQAEGADHIPVRRPRHLCQCDWLDSVRAGAAPRGTCACVRCVLCVLCVLCMCVLVCISVTIYSQKHKYSPCQCLFFALSRWRSAC